MNEEARVVASYEYSLFRIAIRFDGILCFFAAEGMVITFEVSQMLLRAGLTLTEKPLPALVQMEDIARMDRKARTFFASDAYLQIASQTAPIVGSPVSRVIGSFFVSLNRPKYPLRIFTDSGLAVAWLKESI